MLPIVCITGCSSGFGRLIALKAANSCQVIATVRQKKDQQDLLEQALKLNVSIDIQLCDVSKEDDIKQLVDHIKYQYDLLHVLINNAGVAIGGFFEDCHIDQIKACFNTNVFGVMSLTRHLLPLLRKANGAKIINMSSIAGLSASPLISVYNSSKWALEGFSEALLFELKPFNIDVICIEPGQYKTNIFDKNLMFAKHMSNKDSVYYNWSRKAMTLFDRKIKTSLKDPRKVADLCDALIHKKSTRFRYLIGHDARIRLYLRRLLPFEWYKKLINMGISRLITS